MFAICTLQGSLFTDSSQINPNQYIQAHTILKNFSHKYSDKSVLVLGGRLNEVREVAKGYCCAFFVQLMTQN
jgi:ribonucleotide monophosphatase NagD (HAD superfamily)